MGFLCNERSPMPKTFTLQEIADAVDGRLVGDAALRISRLVHPSEWSQESDLALAMDNKLLPLLKGSQAAAAVVSQESAVDFPSSRILVSRPRLALAKLTALFEVPVKINPGIHKTAVVEKGAKLGKNVAVGAFVFVGKDAAIGDGSVIHPHCTIGEGVRIGEGALIHAGVRIGAGTKIGARAIIHFNASIGADGFSFVTPQTGSVEAAKASGGTSVTASNTALIRIASLAPVIIGDDVEIGANSCIDRGTISSTRIGNGTKIDNQVQIGHNVQIGDNCMLCGRVGIAGSVTIGNRVVLGGAAGVADHVVIGDDVIAMAMAGIGSNIPSRTIVGGCPAVPRDKLAETHFGIARLKQFFNKIDGLAARLDKLEKSKENG